MNIKENLKDGIKEGDWKKVCSFYQNMFGEKINPPNIQSTHDPKMPVVADALREIVQLIDPGSHSENSEPSEIIEEVVPEASAVVENENESDDYDDTNFVKNKITEASDPVSTEFIPSSEFVLPEDEVQGYTEGIEDHMKNRRRSVRDPYQPQTKQCQVCGKEFDFNKEYPAGILERQSKIKCNKCRASSG